METFYLIDFENVGNKGLENIDNLSQNDHVHIFSTENAPKIRIDIVFQKKIDVKGHIVPVRKQSLDMHLVSYLGHLLGVHGEQSAYVIVSKDKDYDNIINFWKEEGYTNISREPSIPRKLSVPSKTVTRTTHTKTSPVLQTVNSKISAGMDYEFSGEDRSELNLFMQHGLIDMGYSRNDANGICKYVVAHCNDERMLMGIHNDLIKKYENYSKVYADVKSILDKFVTSKSIAAKRESQIRSFFGKHFKEKLYVDQKKAIIDIILKSETRQQVNNGLLKLYSDGNIVKHIYQTVQPLIKDLPGK